MRSLYSFLDALTKSSSLWKHLKRDVLVLYILIASIINYFCLFCMWKKSMMIVVMKAGREVAGAGQSDAKAPSYLEKNVCTAGGGRQGCIDLLRRWW